MPFDPTTSPIDYALLAGRRTPGLCEVLGATSKRRWDVRRSYAMGGAFTVYRGIDLARPTLKIRLYSPQDWADWHEFAPLVLREPPPDAARVRSQQRRVDAARQERNALLQATAADPTLLEREDVTSRLDTVSRRAEERVRTVGRRPRALEIWHPILEEFAISSVVVEDVLQPVQTADGEWTIEIKLLEYREPRFALATPEGSQAAAADPDQRFIDRIDSALQVNQALQDRINQGS